MQRITIANMACGGCAKSVVATLKTAAPDIVTEVDLVRREVRVAATDVVPLVAALRADGWEAAIA